MLTIDNPRSYVNRLKKNTRHTRHLTEEIFFVQRQNQPYDMP